MHTVDIVTINKSKPIYLKYTNVVTI
jgi:hypothetical protein